MKRAFLGLDYDPLTLDQAIAWVEERLSSAPFQYVVTPNVDHVVRLDKSGDPAIAAAYAGADLTLCDSRILARLARLSHIDLPIVPGSDLTRDWLQRTAPGKRIAVIGGDGVLHASLATRFPEHSWLFHEPPMLVLRDPAAQAEIARFVETGSADIALFAIGAPQSEVCCAQIAEGGRARGVALCIGASLEFVVGAKARAPIWMQTANLEWLFRLLSEPRRLWRRYLIDGPRIFRIWSRWRAQS